MTSIAKVLIAALLAVAGVTGGVAMAQASDGRDDPAGELRGPCDEAEHANDPACAGVANTTTTPRTTTTTTTTTAEPGEDRAEPNDRQRRNRHRGSNRGRSSKSGHSGSSRSGSGRSGRG